MSEKIVQKADVSTVGSYKTAYTGDMWFSWLVVWVGGVEIWDGRRLLLFYCETLLLLLCKISSDEKIEKATITSLQ